MIGSLIIESLNHRPVPTSGCRSCVSPPLPVSTVNREDAQLAALATATFRENQGTDAPVALPGPDQGSVRVWMKNSVHNNRVLDVRVTDDVFCAVVEWPRDFYDVMEDDILLASGNPALFEDRQAVMRTIVSYRMLRGAPRTHRTYAVEKGEWSKDFAVYEESADPASALARFEELRPDSECEPSTDHEALLRVNGVLGLAETKKGQRLLGCIREAIGKGLLKVPIQYDDYTDQVEDPLSMVEAGALVNLGILCSKCPGMTWGDVGYELMRGWE